VFLPTYLILLTFNITATLACAVYCFKIARFKITPTFTYMSYSIGFCLRLFTQLQYIIFVAPNQGLSDGLGTFLIVMQIIEVAIIMAFLLGISRTYYMIKRSPLCG